MNTVSLTRMVKRLAGLHNTRNISDWENAFITWVLRRTRDGDDTRSLSDKQIECVERIYEKHFAD